MWMRASLVTAAALTLAIAPGSAVADTGLESHLAQRANELRAASGLPPLQLDGSLSASARDWSSHMAAEGSLSHSAFPGSGGGRRGENVGMGADVDQVHATLVDSPTHRANLLDPEFTHLGLGVVVAGDGTVFVTQQFLRPNGPATSASPAPEAAEAPPAVDDPSAGERTGDAPAENPLPATPEVEEAPSPAPAPTSADPAPEPSDRLIVNLTFLRHLDG